MKKTVFSFITAAVVSLSYLAVFCCNDSRSDKVYSEEYICGDYIEMDAGGFRAVKWDTGYKFINIMTPDSDLISIVNIIGKNNIYYTRIKINPGVSDGIAEIRAYIDDIRYFSIFINISCQDVPYETTTPVTSFGTTVPTTTPATFLTTTPAVSGTFTTPNTTTTGMGGGAATTTGTHSGSSTTNPEPTQDSTTTSKDYVNITTTPELTTKNDDSNNTTSKPTGSPVTEPTTSSFCSTYFDSNIYLYQEPGDIDGNEVVEMSDLTVLSQFLMGDIQTLPLPAMFAADVIPSPDSVPDIADLAHLKQFIMKENVKLGATDVIFR